MSYAYYMLWKYGIIVLHPESSLDLNIKKIGKIYPIGRIGVLKMLWLYSNVFYLILQDIL
jgi:hypothetical protein